MIYSAGRTCPVCFDSSDVIFLKNIASEQIFFSCYACGCAWGRVPNSNDNFDILSPSDFAPGGFVLATMNDIQSSKLVQLVSQEDSEILSKEFSRDDLLKLFQ